VHEGKASPPSPEFDLLCKSAAIEIDPELQAQIASCHDTITNWPQLIRLADHHGVLPLVARNLLLYSPNLPRQIAESLKSAYETNARRNLWFAAELARVADHFEKKKIPFVPYKGPALAETVYGDLALRTFNDLDLLISRDDFAGAKEALDELGYKPSAQISPKFERFWLRNGYERSFDGAAGKYLVELQWQLLPRFYAVDLRTETLLKRAVKTSVAGCTPPILSPEDLLAVLCLHGAKHLWMRLIWIADIAHTIRTQHIDYDLVISRAQTLGIRRILSVSFWLARNLLGTTLPEAAEKLIAQDSAIATLGHTFAKRLQRCASYDFESTEYFQMIIELRERQTDRWRFIWRLLWTPGEADFSAIDLPEYLFLLYRALRIGRLARKLV
jgi:hypothetical protein